MMLPPLTQVKQNVSCFEISDIRQSVLDAITHTNAGNIGMSGKTIGITAGSRGINAIPEIISSLVEFVKSVGGKPVLIPSMGTHGGATPEGQYNVLKSLGIREDSTGAPISFCVDTREIGKTVNGIPVYCNVEAAKVDGLIVVNRVKQHTDFSGTIESGICKMLAIGLGSFKGALTTHSHALLNGYEGTIKDIAGVMIEKLPIMFAVGIIENWKGKTSHIKVMLPGEIIAKEPIMLKKAKESAIKLPFEEINVLIIKEIGKNISGTGMDTKVVGRIYVKGQREPDGPSIDRIVVLDLTPESHGNAIGIGLADITTRRLYKQVNIRDTALNSISSMCPEQGRLPCILESDKEAIESAFLTLGAVEPQKARIVFIKNTLELETFYVSEVMLGDIQEDKNVEIIGDPQEMCFDREGNLINLF